MNGSNVPEQLTSDYVQLGLHMGFLLVGLPINFVVFIHMGRLFNNARSRVYLLYLNLSISDMMVLIFHSMVRCFWLAIYRWEGGEFVCRLIKFLESLSFSISSNVMVCIALDRLYSLHRPFQANRLSRVTKMLSFAWCLATMTSVPQIFLYRTFVPYENFPQCTVIWKMELYRLNNNLTTVADPEQYRKHIETKMKLYEIYHVVTLFWVPLGILSVSYALLLKAIDKRQGVNINAYESQHSNGDDNDRKYSNTEGLRRVSGGRQIARARSQTMRTTLMLVTIYIGCWLPYNSLSLWHIINPSSYQIYQDTLYFLNALVVLNSVLNPFVYGRLQFCELFKRTERRSSHLEPSRMITKSETRKSVTFQMDTVKMSNSRSCDERML